MGARFCDSSGLLGAGSTAHWNDGAYSGADHRAGTLLTAQWTALQRRPDVGVPRLPTGHRPAFISFAIHAAASCPGPAFVAFAIHSAARGSGAALISFSSHHSALAARSTLHALACHGADFDRRRTLSHAGPSLCGLPAAFSAFAGHHRALTRLSRSARAGSAAFSLTALSFSLSLVHLLNRGRQLLAFDSLMDQRAHILTDAALLNHRAAGLNSGIHRPSLGLLALELNHLRRRLFGHGGLRRSLEEPSLRLHDAALDLRARRQRPNAGSRLTPNFIGLRPELIRAGRNPQTGRDRQQRARLFRCKRLHPISPDQKFFRRPARQVGPRS